MIGFIIGLFVGGLIGIMTICCCIVAGQADHKMECTENEDEIC